VTIAEISVHELSALGASARIIDVRERYEWDEGHTHTDRHAAHWVQLAKCLEANYLKHDGFVVWGALDQAPYTATALSFTLENLGKTVIFTGCQISFAHALADGMKNLFASVMLAGTVEVPEVCIFDNNKLFRANRCRLGNSAAAARFSRSAISAGAGTGRRRRRRGGGGGESLKERSEIKDLKR